MGIDTIIFRIYIILYGNIVFSYKNMSQRLGKEYFMLKKRLFGMITLMVGVMLVFTFMGCSSGGGGGDGGPKYTSVKSSGGSGIDVYELEIGSKEGDSYTLTINLLVSDITKVSTGKITAVDGDVYTLGTFKVTITGKLLTEISGPIPTDKGTQVAPGTVSPVTKGGNKTLDGTYEKGGETVKFSGGSFSYTGEDGKFPGTALYDDSFLVTRGKYQGISWVVGGSYKIKENGTINFIGFNDSNYNGDWVKK